MLLLSLSLAALVADPTTGTSNDDFGSGPPPSSPPPPSTACSYDAASCSTGFADNFCSYPTPPAPTATPLKTLLKRLASAIGPAILGGR